MDRVEERWWDGASALADRHTRAELEAHAAEGRKLAESLRARAEIIELAIRDLENGVEAAAE